MTWTAPRTWAVEEENTAAKMNEISTGLTYLYDALPIRATCWHDESTVTNGNAIAVSIISDQRYNFLAFQDTAADGDVFTQSIVLSAGTYTMYVLGNTNSSHGKLDWTLGSTSIATGQDWYSGSLVRNVLKTVSSITISTGGRFTLTGTVNGHNASSTDYLIVLMKFWFKQASD